MSTNKTEHYNLHLWEPGDDFLREEFNENFATLDAAARFTAGTFTGDGEDSQFISLGFTPTALLVEKDNATRPPDTHYTPSGGLALAGHPMQKGAGYPVIAVEAGGFRVYRYEGYTGDNNSSGQLYHFLALR